MHPFLIALTGGLLIGLASLIVLAGLGRITGISSIFSNAVFDGSSYQANQNLWRWFFVIGLIVGPLIAHQLLGLPVPAAPQGSTSLAIAAGLIVGFGTRLGCGCTSGHGICGMARFSKRSIIATLTFMATGFITVFIMRHAL